MRTILITSQKGGVGKSTLTLLLAIALSQNNKVAILDFDNQGSFLTNKEELEEVHSFKVISKEIFIKDVEYVDNFDYLLIDTPPYNDSTLNSLIEEADYICVPTKLADLDFVSMQTTLERINDLGAKNRTIIVPNMLVNNANYNDYYSLIDEMGFKRVEYSLSNYVGISKLFLTNKELNSNAKTNIRNTMNEILASIN